MPNANDIIRRAEAQKKSFKSNLGELIALDINHDHSSFNPSSRLITSIDQHGYATVETVQFNWANPDSNGTWEHEPYGDLFRAKLGSLWLFRMNKTEKGRKAAVAYRTDPASGKKQASKLSMQVPIKEGTTRLLNGEPFTPAPILGLRLCFIPITKGGTTEIRLHISGYNQRMVVFGAAVSGSSKSCTCTDEKSLNEFLRSIGNSDGVSCIPQNTRSFIIGVAMPLIAAVTAKNDMAIIKVTPEAVVEAVTEKAPKAVKIRKAK